MMIRLTRQKQASLRALIVLLVAVLATGCFSIWRDYPNARHYLLTAVREGAPRESSEDSILRVTPLRIAPTSSTQQFVIRYSDHRFEQDYYNRFLVSPELNITGETINWLEDSGLFSTLIRPGSSLDPDFLLEGMVRELVVDDSQIRSAVLKIEYTLIDTQGEHPRIVITKSYRAESPTSGEGAEEAADAWSMGLTQILTEFESDLAEALK